MIAVCGDLGEFLIWLYKNFSNGYQHIGDYSEQFFVDAD